MRRVMSLLLLLLTIGVVGAELVAKDTFIVGEPVFMNTTNESARLLIHAPDATYRLIGQPGAEIPFVPKTPGNYTIELVDATGKQVAMDTFTVVPGETNTTRDITILPTAPRFGDPVMILIAPPPLGPVRVVINAPGGTFRYVGLWVDSPFMPKSEGPHEIIVTEKDVVTGSLEFDVLPPISELPEPNVTENETIPDVNITVNETENVTNVIVNVTNETVNVTPNVTSTPPKKNITQNRTTNATTIALKNSAGVEQRASFKFFTRGKRWNATHDLFDCEIVPERIAEKLVVHDVVPSAENEIGLDDVPTTQVELDNIETAFAVNLDNLNFTNATLTRVAQGSALYKCALWNFTTQTCYGTWKKVQDLIPGREYNITLYPGDPGFAEAGVATVNTKKPIYTPGETAELIMVVLDTAGFPVSNASVTLLVTAPDNGTTTLTTAQGDIIETKTGVYETAYNATALEGVYLLNITALVTNVSQTMSSHFLVNSSFDFDIVRNTPVTIDPSDPFNSSVTITPLILVSSYNYTEVLPKSFVILDGGGATVTNDSTHLYLTWTGLTDTVTVNYTADAPNIIPNIEVLGPSVVSHPAGVFAEARPWYMAIDPIVDLNEGDDVTVIALDNETLVLGWIDEGSTHSSFEIWNIDGTQLIDEVDFDTTGSSDNRISATPINTTHFALAIVDSPDDHVDFYLYNRSGNQVQGETNIDTDVATNADVKLCQLGDRFAAIYADDSIDDVQFEIWDNDGTVIVTGTALDTDMSPESSAREIVDCAVLNSSLWVAVWFDDVDNDVTMEGVTSGGTVNSPTETDIDTDVDEISNVGAAGLRDNRFGVVYYEEGLTQVVLTIREVTSGGAFSTVLANTVIDSTVSSESRVAAAEVENWGLSSFVAAWQDIDSGDIKAVVYYSNGTQQTAPFTITADEHTSFQLIDVVGTYSVLDRGLCEETFAITYTNSSNNVVFEVYYMNGTVWNGCPQDNESPSITLNAPADNTNFTASSVTFNWTVTDDKANVLECNLTVDGVVRFTNTSTRNGVPSVTTLEFPDGTYLWNVTCVDTKDNSNTSETRTFTVDVPPGLVDIDEAIDVDMAAIDNDLLVVAWIDAGDNEASFQIWDPRGTLLVAETDLDTDGDSQSRIAVAPINNTHFSIALVDSPENDVDFWIYNISGSQVQGRTQIDSEIGAFSDVGVCQLGDRFVVVNANDDDNDADFEIWDNDGTNIVAETLVDDDMDPDFPTDNRVDCAVINSTQWVYAWFDDVDNDITIEGVTSGGTVNTPAELDIDNVGATGHVATASLRNNRTAIVFYDSTDGDVTLTVREVSGGAFSTVLANTDIDTDSGNDSRVSAAEIESKGSSHFVVAWQDLAAGDIKAATYLEDGTQIAAPFTVTTEEDATFELIDVVGTNSLLGIGLCNETFAIAYTNSSDDTVFRTYWENGTLWNGACFPNPQVILNYPDNNANLSTSDVTFNWTAIDLIYPTVLCNLTIDGTVFVNNTNVSNNTMVNFTFSLDDGAHLWNVTCSNEGGNSTTSETRTVIVDVPIGLVVDIDMAAFNRTVFAVVYVDSDSGNATYEVRDADGTPYVSNVVFDATGQSESRTAIAPINNTHVAIALADGPTNNIDFFIMDSSGNIVQGPTEIDSEFGTNSDTAVCQVGNRFMVAYADDDNDDAAFEIIDNNGTNITYILNVDGNMAPEALGQNLVDCVPMNSSRFIYAWYDDQANDVSIVLVDEVGNTQSGVTDADTNAGETGQVAIASLRNNHTAVFWYDSDDDDATIAVYDGTGDSFSTVLSATDIDTDAGTNSRVTATEVSAQSNTTSYFFVAWHDTAAGDIKAAVYNETGGEVTAPYTIVATPNPNELIIDAVGFRSRLGYGLCDETLMFAFTNISNETRFIGKRVSGGAWGGSCPVDDSPPNVTAHNPADGQNYTVYALNTMITFNWTVTDGTDTTPECNVTVDGVIVASEIPSPNATVTTTELNITVGTHLYNISCIDNDDNTGYSETRTFTLNLVRGVVDRNESRDVDMAALGSSTLVVAWLDSADEDASFEIWDTAGTLLVDETDLDTDGDSESRIAIAPINTTHFVIAVIDSPEDDLDFWIYNSSGSQIQGRTEIDSSIGAFTDVGACQLGNRFIVVNANDADNDADFEIWDNNGTNIVPETLVDDDMDPDFPTDNRVDCAVQAATQWVYAWFDDVDNDITIEGVTEAGTVNTPTELDIDNVGATGHVATASLRNNRFAVVFYDSTDGDVTLTVREVSGGAFSTVLANTDIDTDSGNDSRVSAAEIEFYGESHFAIAWQDLAAGDIKAAVYYSNGTELTAPFTVTTQEHGTFQLIDVVGTNSLLDFGLCDETFAIAYTNSSNYIKFETYWENGTIWNGTCIPDTELPVVTLNSPDNNTNFSVSSVTFNWTVTDNRDPVMECNLTVDGVVRAADVASQNNVSVARTLVVVNGDHTWNVVCADGAGNVNTSETRIFNVNVLGTFNNVTLPRLGELGTVIYVDSSNTDLTLQRNWTGVLGPEESLAPSIGGDISWQRFVCMRTRPECLYVGTQTDNSVDFAVFDIANRVWTNLTTLDGDMNFDGQQNFDVACEDDGVSEDCVIVYETEEDTDDDFAYRVWNSSGLSAQQLFSIGPAPSDEWRWLKLYAQKGTTTIGGAAQNTGAGGSPDIYAFIWDGSTNSFGNLQALTTSGAGNNRRHFDCAWEGASEELICAYGTSSNDLFAYEFDTSTSTWTSLGNIYDALAADAWEVTLCGEDPHTDDFSHDVIGVMTCDESGDRDGGVWDGSSFSKTATTDTPAQDTSSECGGNEGNSDMYSQDCSWEKSGNEIIFTWVDANVAFPEGGIYRRVQNDWSFVDWGSGFQIGATGANDVEEVITTGSPGSDDIFLLDQDEGEDLSCAIWTGRAFDWTDCGDFEADGTGSASGKYIDFDWLMFKAEPLVTFIVPVYDTRVYDYQGITNPSTTNRAYEGGNADLPPTSAQSPLTGTEATSTEYAAITQQNDTRWQTTISGATGEHAYQSFRFEINQSTDDIREITIFHEGYATQQTTEVADTFYLYLYNHTSDAYVLQRTIIAHDNDVFTEITLTADFDDYIQRGDLYVLLIGDQLTAGGADARADMHTDYIDVTVRSIPQLRGLEDINVSAIDGNGIDACLYHYWNASQQVTTPVQMNKTNATHFVNVSNTTAIANGIYNLSAVCNDTFDKDSNETIEVRIDNTAPVITLVSPVNGANVTSPNVTFVWNATDNANGRLLCNLTLDGSVNVSNIFSDSGIEENRTINNIPEGTHTWNVTCVDAAGNVNTSETRTFTLDTGPPTIVLNAPADGFNTNNNNVTFNYTPTDAIGIDNCSLIINGAINQTNTSINNTNPNLFFENNVADGFYTWSVNCTDTFGFEGSSVTRNFTIDTTPPSVFLNTTDGSNFTNGTATLNFTAIDILDGVLVCNITINGVVEDADINATNNTLVSRNLSLQDGLKFWNVTCIDDAGNVNISETRNFTLTGPPFMILHLPPDNSFDNGTFVNFTYFASDGDGILNCSLVFDGIVNKTDTNVTNPGNNTFNLTNIAEGVHNWTVTCIDNTSSSATPTPFTITIDQTPPNIDLLIPAAGAVVAQDPVLFNFTPVDNYAPNMTCNLTIDGTVAAQNLNFLAINNTVSERNQTLINGLHYWNVTCIDLAGNSNISLTRNFTVNVTFPVNVTVTTDKTSYQAGELANVSVTTANETGGAMNATVSTDIIYTNTSSTDDHWWNTSWERRIPIFLSNNNSLQMINTYVEVNVSGIGGFMTTCNNEARIIFHQSASTDIINRTVIDSDDANWCIVGFLANISANAVNENRYYFYYNNSAATDPGNLTNASIAYVNATFEVSVENFAYIDDIYQGTSNPAQESGARETNGNCANGDCLAVNLNVESSTSGLGGYSGGWNITFNITGNPDQVNISFNYSMRLDENLESSENTSIYYRNISNRGERIADTLVGNGNGGGDDFVNGTFTYSPDVNNGTFDFDVGCWLSEVSATDENAECWIDNVKIIGFRLQDANVTSSTGEEQIYLQTDVGDTGSDGNHSFIFNTSGQNQGNYSAVARATAVNYTAGIDSTVFRIISDVFGPEITLLSPPNQTTLFPPQNVTFVYVPNDIGTTTENCSLIINDVLNQTNTSITEGVNNTFNVSNLPEGFYLWTVNCTDGFGNVGTTDPFSLTLDATAPTVTAHNPNGTTINNNTITFNFTAIDNFDDIMLCNLSVDNGNFSALVNATNNTLTNVVIANITDGFHLWNVTCSDNINNNATSNTLNFTIDAAPFVTLDAPADGFGSNTGNITFTYFVTESNLANCSLILNDAINQTANASDIPFHDGSNTNNFTLNNTPEGVYNWTINCTDANGFVGTATQRELQVDFTPPNVTLNDPLANETIFLTSITFNFTAFDNIDPILSCNLTINNTVNQSNINASNGQPTTATVNGFTAGLYLWNVTCIDNTGFANTSETRNFTVSSEVNVELVTPLANASDGDGDVTFTYIPSSIFDFDSGGFCEFIFDGSSNQTNITINNGVENTFVLPNATEGIHTWQVNCTDNAGTNGSSEIRNIIFDFSDPSVTAHDPNGTAFTVAVVNFNWTATDALDTILICNVTVNGSVRAIDVASPNGTPTNITVESFTDGYHIWNATCIDDATRTATSNTLNFSVQEPPKIVLGNPGNATRTNVVNQIFYYTPTDNSGNISNCSIILNGTTNTTNTSITNGTEQNFSVNGLIGGTHLWTVNCTDPNGNTGTNLTEQTLYIDLSGPVITLNFPGEGDTLNNNTVQFNWTPVDFNSSIQIVCNLTLDDAVNQTNITGLSGTDFTVTVVNLTDGDHNWSVACVDDLGNVGTSFTGNFTINQPDLFLNASSIAFSNTNPAPGEELNITVNVSNLGGVPAVGINVSFWDGDPSAGGVFIGNDTGTLGLNGSKLFSVLWNITDGFHTIYISADPANLIQELNETNNNGTANISFIKINITHPPNNTVTGDTTPELHFNVTDFTSNNLTYRIFVDGSFNGQTANVTPSSNTTINLSALAEGTRTIIVEATDQLGRSRNSTPHLISVDITAPNVTFLTPNESWFDTTNVTIDFNITDVFSVNIDYTVFLDGILNRTNSTTNNSFNNETFFGLSEGVHNVTIQATDEQGNTANSTVLIFYVDLTPPVPNITTANNSWFNTNSPLLTFNITDNLDPILNYTFFVDGVKNDNGTTINGVENSTNLFSVSEGNHTIILQGLDEAGHYVNSTPIVIYVDVTAPNVTLLYPPNNSNFSQTTVTLNFTVEDNLAVLLECTVLLDGVVVNLTNVSNGSTSETIIQNLTSGFHFWNVTCTDNATNAGISETWRFFIELPDLVITSGNITFSNNTPIENQTIQINATIFNIGNLNVTENITVQFWLGDPQSGGTQINGNQTIQTLNISQNATVSVNHNAVIDLNRIYVVVDPPAGTNGSIGEENESNNIAFRDFNVGTFEVIAGDSSNILKITDASIISAFEWNVTDVNGSHVFVADTDSAITFTEIYGIGVNISNVTDATTNDFEEIDTTMGIENFTETVNNTWTTGGTPLGYRNITSFKRLIVNIPIVNSTNTSSFTTGILWDASDGGVAYNGSQDILFHTIMNMSQVGQHGTYDYEIKIPATLRDYIPGGGTVTFYTELR